MTPIFNALNRISPELSTYFRKVEYEVISDLISDRDEQVTLMNYGYSNPDIEKLEIAGDDSERYSLQLYDHLFSAVPMSEKDVLEVGCGRGGGCSHLVNKYSPRSVTGIDLAENAVKYCQQHFGGSNVTFSQGDAEQLLFKDGLYDVVVNLESSHCYPDVDRFLSEVRRVLKPEGMFLYSDYRPSGQVNSWEDQMVHAGFEIVKIENISPYVLNSLNADHERKMQLLNQLPFYLRFPMSKFAGIKGSGIHRGIESGELEYRFYVLA